MQEALTLWHEHRDGHELDFKAEAEALHAELTDLRRGRTVATALRSGHERLATKSAPKVATTPLYQGPPMHQIRAFLGISMLAGMVISLLLAGCGTRPGRVHALESPVEPEGQVRLSWERPTIKADGTPLADLVGYTLYYGLTSQTYDFLKTVGSQTTYAVSGLEPGRTYYFAVTARDASGHESHASEEVRVTAPSLISPLPMLTQEPLTRGRASEFRVLGVHAGELVSFLFSLAGEGAGPCSPQLGGLCVDLVDPSIFGEAPADTSGTARLTRSISADVPAGHAITIQAVIPRGPGGAHSVKTNAMTAIVQESP